MNIKIPEKYREEFDRSAEFAIKAEKFTLKELAEALEMGELAASIMIGYMEKTGLVTKGKLDDVRKARISLEQWEGLERKIENYKPLPELPEEKFYAEIKQEVITLEDIILPETIIYKTEITAKDSFLILKSEAESVIPVDKITSLFIEKPSFFKKGALVFFTDNELADRENALTFRKKDLESVKKLAAAISEKLGIELK